MKQSNHRGFGLGKYPAKNSFLITPHASNNVDPTGDILPRALLVGVGGTITWRLEGDTVDTQVTLPAGIHDVQPEYIRATGTAATGLVGLY